MNEPRVRIRDIAEELGLSTATVSNVIHGKTGKVSDATARRVQQLLEQRRYIPNMAGIKEAGGNMEQICETMRRIRGKMDLYSGDDNLNLPILAIGGAGLISVVSNIAPKQVKEVYTLVKECKLDKANEIEDKLLPLIDACFTEVNPIPAKYGCCAIGLDAGIPRAPLTELESEHKKIMDECIKIAGVEHL